MTKDINYITMLYFIIMIIPTFIIIYKIDSRDFFKKSSISMVRMIGQLLLLGVYLNYIFQYNNRLVNSGYLLFMIIVSTHSVIDSSVLKGRKIAIITFFTIIIPFIFVNLIFENLVLKLENPLDAMYVIPISGMLLGNSLNSMILVLNDFLNSMKKSKDEYMFYITMGASREEALKPYIKNAILIAIKPKVAQMATLGLVSLPGMMTGQILGGNGPMIAIKYQIAIMISIFCMSVVSSYIFLKFIEKYYFDEYGIIDEKLLV